MTTAPTDIAWHVCSAISRSAIEAHPFAHLVVDGLLPSAVHRALIASLPPIEQYARPERAPATRVAGERAILAASNPALPHALRSILARVHDALCSEAVVGGLLRKLGVADAARGSCGSPGAQVFLARDVPPYAIGPHTDVPARLVSGVLYLSPPDAPAAWGTTLFAPADGRFACAQGRHYGFDCFVEGRTVPFAPNRAVVFPRTDRSFHGLQPIPADARARDVLLFEIVRGGVLRSEAASAVRDRHRACLPKLA